LERCEANGNAKTIDEIKNVLISFSFDNWKQHRMPMARMGMYNWWRYVISEKIKSGFHEYKLIVELYDESQIETYDSECPFIVKD
jgi:1,4-alpha-glucan branching enzyme